MKVLPKNYAWLANEPAPKMIVEALKLYGVHEKAGIANNPTILGWAKECGISYYTMDETPWCGLFMAVIAKRAGKDLPPLAVRAKSWVCWGSPVFTTKLGDVLVFTRNGGGHVGLYVGEDPKCYHVLGGNQGDAVSITRIEKTRCIAVRNHYKIGVPANVRQILLTAEGEVSNNEA